MLAENNLLKKGGKLWLPNLDCVQCSLDEFSSEITKYFEIERVEDPMKNPLYAATENVEDELLRCPDALTNETQIRPLLIYSKAPFLALCRRDEPLVRVTNCVTPSKDRSTAAKAADKAEKGDATSTVTPSKITPSKLKIKEEDDETRRSLLKDLKPKRKVSVSPKREINEKKDDYYPSSPTKERKASIVV